MTYTQRGKQMNRLKNLIQRFFERINRYFYERRVIRELESLSDRELQDIGISRCAIYYEVKEKLK